MTAIVPEDLTSTLKAILDHLVRLDTHLDKIDTRLDGLDTRLDKIDASFNGMDARLRAVEIAVARVDGRVTELPTLIQTVGIMFAIMAGTSGILAAAKLWL